MKSSKRFSAILNLAAVVALSSLASACGGQAYREAQPVDPTSGSGGGGYNWGGGSNTGGGTGGGSNSGGGTTDPNALPALSVDFTLRGRGGISTNPQNSGYIDTTVAPYVFTSPSVETDNLLKVKVTALAGSTVTLSSGSGSNFTANYGCVKYTVKVNNTVRQTQFLRVGGAPNSLCPGAPEFEVLDFSSILASGHHTLSVSVTEARYDFYCQMLYSNMMLPYGPWDPWAVSNYCTNGYSVWKTHNVNGRLQIQVNGTNL
jgi:hypothetical protein